MPQDAFTIKYIANELSERISGGKISKIIQPNKDLLIFIIYTRNGSLKLEICLAAKGCRINLADGETVAPKVAPNFCMLLRKYLQNAEITAVGHVDNERIVYMDLNCVSEFELTTMRLYAELMGKYSNAVLVKDGTIVGALKTTAIGENTKRLLFTGARYSLPEPQDKISPADLPALTEAWKYIAGDRAKFIADRVKGIAYSTALEMVGFYGENISANDVNSYICGGVIEPCVVFSGGEPIDFKVKSTEKDRKLYGSVLEAQTAYYDYITTKQNFEDKKRKLLSALDSARKKVEKRLIIINKKLFDCRDAEEIKLKGELITANIYAVKRGMDELIAVNYYDENGGAVKIQLNKSLSPSENAQRYYKKYAKLKRTAEAVTMQKAEAEKSFDYLTSINSHICAAETLCDLEETEEELKAIGLIKSETAKKKVQKVLPFRTFEYEGFKIISGRNNLQNDRLLKSISPDDLWLHTQGYHSAHVAIISNGKEIPSAVLGVASEICAYYSDGRAGNKIPVDYTYRKFVKKPPKSNAGFVIYTDYKTVLAEPDGHRELQRSEDV